MSISALTPSLVCMNIIRKYVQDALLAKTKSRVMFTMKRTNKRRVKKTFKSLPPLPPP